MHLKEEKMNMLPVAPMNNEELLRSSFDGLQQKFKNFEYWLCMRFFPLFNFFQNTKRTTGDDSEIKDVNDSWSSANVIAGLLYLYFFPE